MSIKNITLRLNMDKEPDRRVYDYLKGDPKSYSKATVTAVCGYLDAQTRQREEDAFLQAVIDTIRSELRTTSPLLQLMQVLQPHAVPVQPPAEEYRQEANDNALSFLEQF